MPLKPKSKTRIQSGKAVLIPPLLQSSILLSLCLPKADEGSEAAETVADEAVAETAGAALSAAIVEEVVGSSPTKAEASMLTEEVFAVDEWTRGTSILVSFP